MSAGSIFWSHRGLGTLLLHGYTIHQPKTSQKFRESPSCGRGPDIRTRAAAQIALGSILASRLLVFRAMNLGITQPTPACKMVKLHAGSKGSTTGNRLVRLSRQGGRRADRTFGKKSDDRIRKAAQHSPRACTSTCSHESLVRAGGNHPCRRLASFLFASSFWTFNSQQISRGAETGCLARPSLGSHGSATRRERTRAMAGASAGDGTGVFVAAGIACLAISCEGAWVACWQKPRETLRLIDSSTTCLEVQAAWRSAPPASWIRREHPGRDRRPGQGWLRRAERATAP